MGIRVLCLICAVAILWMTFFGIHGGAEAWQTAPAQPRRARASAVRSSAPLASAMLLVLGGLGISLLFDKRDKN